jgi:hypothetical protein
MGIDRNVAVNIHVINSGDITAVGVRRAARVKFVRSAYGGSNVPLKAAEEGVFKEIYAELDAGPPDGMGIPSNASVFFTLYGPRLERSDFVPPNSTDPNAIRNGEVLIVAGVVRYNDEEVRQLEFCFFAMNPNRLFVCQGHNSSD